jgi:phytoene dehydrogenase-like protein
MTDAGRVIVIGAGHNGLACAAYLARAGRKVLVLEASDVIGGAAVTREFHPGFRVSACAHLSFLLGADIERELELGRHGLDMVRADLRSVALSRTGPALVLDRGEFAAGELASADRAALTEFTRQLRRFAGVLARQHAREPPRLRWDTWAQRLALAQLGFDVRRLGRADLREFLRIATMNVYDVVGDRFESAQLKGLFALDAVLGTQRGPRSGNTMLNLLHRLSATTPGAYALPRGGMGAITTALAGAARAAGAEIRNLAAVSAILMNGDRPRGVRLAGGEEIAAEWIVSNADPKTTLLDLLGARHLETEFAGRIQRLRARGTTAKLHLALSAKPNFAGLDDRQIGERLVIAPDPDYVERAFDPSKYGECSARPVLEVNIPTVHDPSLAPPGRHVLSAVVQYAPYGVALGWEAQRDRFRAAVLAVLEDYAPGIGALTIGAELLAPPDLEREFRLPGGHWHHAEYTLDQALMLRPVPGAAQYRTPIDGVYLCGAGCHPGGGVMGHAGRNAARALLADGA